MTARHILVIGGHHGVGAHVVRLARAQGHDVNVFEGDVLDDAAVRAAMTGRDAVISTLGPRKSSPPDLCSRGTRNIVDAMRSAGVERLVQVTGAIIGHPRERLGLVYRLIERMVPVAALADRREQERAVQQSGLQWTLVRPTRLTDGPPARALHDDRGELRIGAFAQVAREDVAAFVVRAVDDTTTHTRAFTLHRRS